MIKKLPPPKRYLVEMDTNDDGIDVVSVVDATGVQDVVYIQGIDSPWLGVSLEDIEKYAKDKEYGFQSEAVLKQCELIRLGMIVPKDAGLDND